MSYKIKDLSGRRFGRLTVLKRVENRGTKLMWLCQCTCGKQKVFRGQSLRDGVTNSCGCLRSERMRRGPTHPRWLGGRVTTTAGYIRVHSGGRKRLEHSVVMESILCRPLLSSESVHHKNGVRNDNRPENLELWSGSQPKGQRVTDKVAWAVNLLKIYKPEALAEKDLPLLMA